MNFASFQYTISNSLEAPFIWLTTGYAVCLKLNCMTSPFLVFFFVFVSTVEIALKLMANDSLNEEIFRCHLRLFLFLFFFNLVGVTNSYWKSKLVESLFLFWMQKMFIVSSCFSYNKNKNSTKLVWWRSMEGEKEIYWMLRPVVG